MVIEQTSANPEVQADPATPRHVAIIMDGNGRWAKARSWPRQTGHRSGVKAVRRIVEAAGERGIEYLTLFAFSSENWRRPPDEVSSLMSLFIEALQREIDELHENDVRLRFVGAREQLAPRLRERIDAAERRTAGNRGLNLLVAVAYGGRWDIVNAARKLAVRASEGVVDAADIDERQFEDELSLAGVPDPDLLIRTGGEQRISNFLLWNLAYAELWFCDCLWPDFDSRQLDLALAHYVRRQRRYGCTGDQVGAS